MYHVCDCVGGVGRTTVPCVCHSSPSALAQVGHKQGLTFGKAPWPHPRVGKLLLQDTRARNQIPAKCGQGLSDIEEALTCTWVVFAIGRLSPLNCGIVAGPPWVLLWTSAPVYFCGLLSLGTHVESHLMVVLPVPICTPLQKFPSSDSAIHKNR